MSFRAAMEASWVAISKRRGGGVESPAKACIRTTHFNHRPGVIPAHILALSSSGVPSLFPSFPCAGTSLPFFVPCVTSRYYVLLCLGGGGRCFSFPGRKLLLLVVQDTWLCWANPHAIELDQQMKKIYTNTESCCPHCVSTFCQ